MGMKIMRDDKEIELTDRELAVAYNEWNRRMCREDVVRYIKTWGEDNGVDVEKYIADYGLIEEITDDYQQRIENKMEYSYLVCNRICRDGIELYKLRNRIYRDSIELYEAVHGNLDFEEE